MRRTVRANSLALGLLLVAFLAPGSITSSHPAAADVLDGNELRLDELRVVGTHNSFHIPPIVAFHPRHRSRQEPLIVQLERHRVRALELDLHENRRGEYEIYHIAFIDSRSHCKLFVDCLNQLREWSDSNPEHLPLLVWLEIKDYAGGVRIESAKPVDAVIRSALGDRLLIPDDVRGSHASLREAIETTGWPTENQVRGRFLFLMDGRPRHVADYTSGYRHLRDRVMFAQAEPHQFHMGWAGAAKINDPAQPLIGVARAARLLTTTTVCAAQMTDSECYRARDIALGGGANVFMDDYVHRVPDRDYYLDIDGTSIAER